jgi:hypothetical protein
MKKAFFLLFLTSLIFVACKKDKYGNTDIYSNTYSVYWTYEDPSYTATISEAKITQEVIDKGAVMCYMSNGSGGWIALPCTLPMDASYSSTYTPVIFVGGVKIWQTDTDMLTLDPGMKTFKVVVLSEHQMIAHPDLDLTDYESVEEELSL